MKLDTVHVGQLHDLLGSWWQQTLHMATITDIVVTEGGLVYLYEKGAAKKLEVTLSPDRRYAVLGILANANRLVINAQNPSLAVAVEYEGVLLRIQGNVPPVTDEPCFSTRIANKELITIDSYVPHVLTEALTSELREYIHSHQNIMVGGATGSGKTTMVRALVEEIPQEERLLIIEDTPEIFPSHPNCIKLRTSNNFSTRMAVMDAMRHRPDRIIVGEIRDGAAYELLKAFITGHRGGLFTIHADSIDTMYIRLSHLVQEVSTSPQDELINEAVDVAIHLKLHHNKRSINVKKKK